MGNVQMEASQIRYKGQYRNVQEALENGGGGGGGTTVVANPSGAATADLSKLQVGESIYGVPATAAKIAYSNTDSGLTADDVQEAIDELSGAIPGVATTSAPGIVQPDGDTITITDGVISAVSGTASGEVYSTTETLIGLWNNEPLYRKIVNISEFPGAGQTIEVSLGVSNVTYRKFEGCIQGAANMYTIPLFWSTSDNVGASINKSNNTLVLRSLLDYSSASGYVIIYYTKNS